MRAIRYRFIHRGTGPGKWKYELVPDGEKSKAHLDDVLHRALRNSPCEHIVGNVVYRIPKKVREEMIRNLRWSIKSARKKIKILEEQGI